MKSVARFLIFSFVAMGLLFGCKEGTVSEGDTEVDFGPTGDLNSLVCDPFQSDPDAAADSEEESTKGVHASLYYLEDYQQRFERVEDYLQSGTKVEGLDLYFNKIHAPTRPFNRGFITQANELITTSKGDTLYEWFALRLRGQLHKGPGDKHDKYQLAVLADDGAVLRLDRGQGMEVLINNDGTHPTRMACATEPVDLSGDQKLPFVLDYYQGPRYHIALTLMWRPWPENEEEVEDPLCGASGNATFFDSTQNPPKAKKNFRHLIARGWRILRPVNFTLPEPEDTNPCTEPAPIITDVQVADVQSTSARVTWTTDRPASSQVSYTYALTGEELVTDEDTALRTSHSVELTGLQPDSVYVVRAISRSSSGLLTEGGEVYIRTRRLQ